MCEDIREDVLAFYVQLSVKQIKIMGSPLTFFIIIHLYDDKIL